MCCGCGSAAAPPPCRSSAAALLCCALLPPSPVTGMQVCECVSLSLPLERVCSFLFFRSLVLCVFVGRRLCLTVLVCGAAHGRKYSRVLCVSDSQPVSVIMCLCQSAQVVSQELICSVFLLLSVISAGFILVHQNIMPQIGFSSPRGLRTLYLQGITTFPLDVS